MNYSLITDTHKITYHGPLDLGQEMIISWSRLDDNCPLLHLPRGLLNIGHYLWPWSLTFTFDFWSQSKIADSKQWSQKHEWQHEHLHDLCTPFDDIYNDATGLIPNDWRHANVTPLLKKCERYKAENYRHVFLTSICSKLMEHVIASQLMGHLNASNILYALQHGFRDKHLCETQLLALVPDLAHDLNSNKQTDMDILDFSKAFDKVSHERLLYKLQWYGVDP